MEADVTEVGMSNVVASDDEDEESAAVDKAKFLAESAILGEMLAIFIHPLSMDEDGQHEMKYSLDEITNTMVDNGDNLADEARIEAAPIRKCLRNLFLYSICYSILLLYAFRCYSLRGQEESVGLLNRRGGTGQPNPVAIHLLQL